MRRKWSVRDDLGSCRSACFVVDLASGEPVASVALTVTSISPGSPVPGPSVRMGMVGWASTGNTVTRDAAVAEPVTR
jgi:hypothetical protein